MESWTQTTNVEVQCILCPLLIICSAWCCFFWCAVPWHSEVLRQLFLLCWVVLFHHHHVITHFTHMMCLQQCLSDDFAEILLLRFGVTQCPWREHMGACGGALLLCRKPQTTDCTHPRKQHQAEHFHRYKHQRRCTSTLHASLSDSPTSTAASTGGGGAENGRTWRHNQWSYISHLHTTAYPSVMNSRTTRSCCFLSLVLVLLRCVIS